MTDSDNISEIMEYTSRIVAAYVSNRPTSINEIPHITGYIYQAISEIHRNPHMIRTNAAISPAVPIDESVQEDYIVCLEDGKKLQMLKRHLQSVYGLTLQQYKDRWGLPNDYPVVAPSYARRRSAIAKNTGLGKTGRKRRIQMLQIA